MEQYKLKAINIVSNGEGYKPRPYQCSKGKWTWGVGRNYQDYPLTLDERLYIVKLCSMSVDPIPPWTMDQTTFILSNIDSDKAENIAMFLLQSVIDIIDSISNDRFEWYKDTDGPRRCVWIDWAYCMGLWQVSGFKTTISLMAAKDYATIAENAKTWQWAKDVWYYPPGPSNPYGSRAWYIIEMLRTGQYPNWA